MVKKKRSVLIVYTYFVRVTFITVALWLLPGLSAESVAHGVLPAPLSVVGGDQQQLSAVRITRGLVVRTSEGSWRFQCPVSWGGPDTPPAYEDAGQLLWVAGAEDIYQVLQSGEAVPTGFHLGTVRQLISLQGDVIALVANEEGSGLYLLQNEGYISMFEDVVVWESMATDGENIYLVADLSDGLHLMTLTGEGIFSEEVIYGEEEMGGVPVLVSAGEALYLRSLFTESDVLSRLDEETITFVYESAPGLHGPVDVGGKVLLVSEDVLFEVGESGLLLLDDSFRYLCLDSYEGQPYVCEEEAIWFLDEEGQRYQEPSFVMSDIGEPQYLGLELMDTYQCEGEWLDLAIDTGLDFQGLADGAGGGDMWQGSGSSSGGSTGGGCTCRTVAHEYPGGFILLLFACVLIKLRKRPIESRV